MPFNSFLKGIFYKIKFSMKYLILVSIISLSLFACENQKDESVSNIQEKIELTTYQTGDIVFQTSTSSQSKAIQLATNSKYSHVGIIVNEQNKLYVLEAVQPVKLTLLNEWINRGKANHFVVKRLENADEILTKNKIQKAVKVGKKMIGKNYDSAFEWSNKKIYCSELVWKIYKEGLNIKLCDLKKLKDFNLENEVVKAKLKERYGNNIPMDEKVVSPQDIFESKKLITIY